MHPALFALLLLLSLTAILLAVGIIINGIQRSKEPKAPPPPNISDVKSRSIIARAIKKANSMLVQAELESIKTTAEHKNEMIQVEKAYEKEFSDLVTHAKANLTTLVKQAESESKRFYQTTETSISGHLKDNEQRIVNSLDLMMSEAEKTMQVLSEDMKIQLNKQISKELEEVRAELGNYKEQRMRVVDEQIVSIVEETVRETLGVALSSKDNADLVLQSLEHAKSDAFLGKSDKSTTS